MKMRLRIDTNKDGTKNYYVMESYRTDEKKTTTRIVKKLILKIDLIHYRHPLRNLNVMLVTPVTETSLSNG